jgi:phosphate starvation-inducible PhoH-like protein
MENGVIEVAPLAFMRGRTLATPRSFSMRRRTPREMQMKMFLTRLGENSRMAITGDPSQVDLPRGVTSGLVEALSILEGVDGVVTCRFRGADVVRHPLVQRIVEAYDKRIYPKAEGDA